MNNVEVMNIKMRRESRTSWNTLLQKGFHVHAPAGKSVREFLNLVFEYDDAFIDGSVRTVFLNSSPVDDIDRTRVKDGDRLAMGTAMPGLVGIVMGRNNPYKSFRSDIACQGDGVAKDERGDVRVFVKVFSSLAVKTGEDILRRGVEWEVGVLSAYLRDRRDFLVDGPSPDELPAEGYIRLAVEFV